MTDPKDAARRRLFVAMLKRAELPQRQFARLVGADPITVNRWCADPEERDTAVRVPKYALLVLKMFVDLGPTLRKRIIEETAHW